MDKKFLISYIIGTFYIIFGTVLLVPEETVTHSTVAGGMCLLLGCIFFIIGYVSSMFEKVGIKFKQIEEKIGGDEQ